MARGGRPVSLVGVLRPIERLFRILQVLVSTPIVYPFVTRLLIRDGNDSWIDT